MCNLCKKVESIKSGNNPFLIKEFEHVYWILGDHQYFKGYSQLLLKHHRGDVTELTEKEHLSIQKNLRDVSVFLKNHFNAFKTNQSCLGNFEPHLHWHIFPRYEEDLAKDETKNPWHCIQYFDDAKLSDDEARKLAQNLSEEYNSYSL